VAAVLSVVPGAIVTIELAFLFLKYFVPIAGMLPAPMPLDPLIAALVGMAVVAVGALAFAVPHRVGGFGWVAIGCAVVAIVGIAFSATRFPYTPERPKRLLLAHVADDQESALLLRSGDALDMKAVLASEPAFVPARSRWSAYEVWLPPFTHERQAAPARLAPPRVEVLRDDYNAATDRRDLRVRVSGPGAQLRLLVPSGRLAGWSLAPSLDATLAVGGQHVAHFEGLGPAGHELSLTAAGRAPLPIELRAIDRVPASDPVIDDVKRRLPPWTTTTSISVRTTRLAL
jgi:hypothetical protein